MSRITRTRARSASTLRLAALALTAPLLLAGCAGSAPDTATASAASTEASTSTVALRDGWAKAGDGMTGVFGSIVNDGDTDLTLVRAESPAAGMIELHETVTTGGAATMREVDGGFTIPAGGSFELEPGGNHIMFMDMPEALLAGDEVPLTLTFDDDSTLEVTVLVKDFSGAQENYEGGDSHDSMDSHDGADGHGADGADGHEADGHSHDADDAGH